MRLRFAIFIGTAFLCGGCTTVPTVMGFSGRDSVPLNTREQVHDALGTPISTRIAGDIQYEEFQVRNGCDQIILGYRVPAFQPLEEFHIWGKGELRLISVKDYSCIPTCGKNLIVVAAIENVLYFRLFDDSGNMVVDIDERKLRAKTGPIAELKKQLENLWPPHKLAEEEKDRVISAVASILGRIPLGSFEIGVANVKYYGPMMNSINLPSETNVNRQRVFRGQILCFEYDKSGKVANVYLDGELVLSATKNSDTAAISANPQR
jgi:hypothetical protein